MSSEIALKVENISKCYQIYAKPQDRMKQFFYPKLQRIIGKQPTRYFEEFRALENVSFEVKRGETVGIIGCNGSGKSTLLQIICGTLNATDGSVEVNGRLAALLELGSGFNPDFTGCENVFLNASILGLTKAEIESCYDEIIAFADIGDFINHPVKTYSSGMAIRLAFAIAINIEPQILVVDEALSVGDELFQRKCFSRIEKIKQNGATILFVSHAASTIVELCDRTILLDSGQQLAMGSPKAIVGDYQRLLYAPQEKQAEIRQSIQNFYLDSSSLYSIADELDTKHNLSLKKSKSNMASLEFFDPNLKSTTAISYESLGACISPPEIFTLSGEKVNFLKTGGTYYYDYSVQFDRSSSDVRFGMMIKNINGIELGGIGSAPENQGIEHIAARSKIKVRFSFQCHLVSGQYFINAGCSGKINDESVFLHRIVDAITFRVLPESQNEERAGYIDFATKDTYFCMDIQE